MRIAFSPRRLGYAAADKELVADTLCLVAITIASALPYLSRLGFYSDDWGLLAEFSTRTDISLAALAVQEFAARPVQGLYLTLLFSLFGLHALGYHVVNTAVLAVSSALFYILLRRLRLGRAESFAGALLFVLLPQLSTVRVWYSAFQIPLSMMLMLLSMHCQLSFVRRGGIAWLCAAIATALLSVGAYEIFAPLLAAFAAGLVFESWRRSSGAVGTRVRQVTVAGGYLIGAILLAGATKLSFSDRTGRVADPHRYLLGLHQLFRLDYDWRVDSGLNIIAAPRALLWAPVEGWWRGASGLVEARSGIEVTIIAAAIAAVAFWRLSSHAEDASALKPLRLLWIGLATLVLGNATFLIVPSIAFTSTGVGNRVQVAAALGAAMTFAAVIRLGARVVPQQYRAATYAGLLALISAAAFARLSAIESYWARVPQIQQRILSAAKADLRTVPSDSTVILDGICPYLGPAITFEANWDVAGALTLTLGRPVNGDVVSPRMSPTDRGLLTSIYKDPSFYPYGQDLYIYDPTTHRLARLRDRQAAAAYFAAPRPRCPGFVARGVEI